jgi:hypothetical protein
MRSYPAGGVTEETREERVMSAITVLQVWLPVVSEGFYVVLLLFYIRLAWLKIRDHRDRDED